MQQQKQLQQLMQMQQHQPMMSSSSAYYPNNVTTDHIQQYLDENKSLILKIVESQNSGRMSECAENQARLQQNLMYLAAIADSQPQPPSFQAQYGPSGVMHQGALQMQHPQSVVAARSSMLYNTQQQQQQQQQQSYSTLQQQQSVHNQLSMNSGFHMLQGNVSNRYSDFGRESSGGGGGGEGLLGGTASGSGDGREGQHSGGSHNNSNGN